MVCQASGCWVFFLFFGQAHGTEDKREVGSLVRVIDSFKKYCFRVDIWRVKIELLEGTSACTHRPAVACMVCPEKPREERLVNKACVSGHLLPVELCWEGPMFPSVSTLGCRRDNVSGTSRA